MKKASKPTRLRLTNKSVDALLKLPPEQRARRYWDSEFSPLYLQFSRAGAASYVMRYTKLDGRDGDFAIGSPSFISADAARAAARERMADLTLNGIDPVEARRQGRQQAMVEETDNSFRAVADAYLAAKAKRREGKPPLSEVSYLRKHVYPVLGDRDIDAIKQSDIVALIDDIKLGVLKRRARKRATGTTTANITHKAIKRVFKYAVATERATRNPAAFQGMANKVPKRRGRLNEERFKLYWDEMLKACLDTDRPAVALAVMIYMVTLQRPVDVARARRNEINFETRTWRPSETKTGVEYFVPLSDLAVALMKEAFRRSDSEWLFPKAFGRNGHMIQASLTNCWFRVRNHLEEKGMLMDADVQLYDCRRFGRTQIRHKLGYDLDVAEAVINHHDNSKMETLYDVHDFDDQIRDAQESWGREIMKMIGIESVELFDA